MPDQPDQRGASVSVDEAFLYAAPEGVVLYKPEFAGWTLFIKEAGAWRVVDSFDRARRGERYSPAAVGVHSPGFVVHQPPSMGYYREGTR